MNAFKDYDIRGIYPTEIDEKFFYRIGLTLKKLGYRSIAIGRDARLSSDQLHIAFCAGALNAGVDIMDVGVVTSPMLSFFCASKNMDGAMITASHNPKEYNGLKFIDSKGIQLSYNVFTNKIEKLIEKDNFSRYLTKNKGNINHAHLKEVYVKYIINKFKNSFDKRLKVVFDCSNGVASIPLIPILKELNIEHILINRKPDGNFPNHEPNQTIKENLLQLQEHVRKNEADMGIIFDGDADRVSFVDEKGEIIDINSWFLILAKNLIDKNTVKKSKILFDLRFSRYVYEFLDLYGAKPIIMRVGNPYYKNIMFKDKKVLISGELSGHIMFSENYCIDDAIFAALRFIEIISHRDKKVSTLIKDYKKYYTSSEISLHTKFPKDVIGKIEKYYKKEKRKYIDGLSVIKKRTWFNVRKSNTEPLIRLVVEGYTKEEVEEELNNIKGLVSKYD